MVERAALQLQWLRSIVSQKYIGRQKDLLPLPQHASALDTQMPPLDGWHASAYFARP